ncbi:hypothetical protein RR47_GL000428 [Enterococcus columbae DSM 7374 = ATCC 51263]|nr:hypothetical protein RR47_GL000428 [Enterococcus columbae DSM 7374 = ATCC 51263]
MPEQATSHPVIKKRLLTVAGLKDACLAWFHFYLQKYSALNS